MNKGVNMMNEKWKRSGFVFSSLVMELVLSLNSLSEMIRSL